MYGILVQGKKHKLRNTPCEDSIYIISEPNEAFVAVLCDGMGSYGMSGSYAKELTKEAANFLYEKREVIFHINNSDFKDDFFEFEKAFTQEFAKRNPGTQFGSTLIAVVIPAEHNEFAILHVGDGAVLGTSKCNSEFAMVFSNAENYGFQDATISVSNQNAKNHLRFIRQRKEDYECLLFGSDGGIAPFATSINIASGYTYDVIRDVMEEKRSLSEVVLEDHFGVCNVMDDISLLLLKLSNLPFHRSIHCYINPLTPEELEKNAEHDKEDKDQAQNISKSAFSFDESLSLEENGYQKIQKRKRHDQSRNHKKGVITLLATVCLIGLLAMNLYTYSIASIAQKNVQKQNKLILDLKTDIKDLEVQVNILEKRDNVNENTINATVNTDEKDQDTVTNYLPIDDDYR